MPRSLQITTGLARLIGLLLVAVFQVPLTSSAFAQASGDFAGKQITISIGYGVGGTYYQYAKLFADHMGRFIPGKPEIIVQSLPGAGGLRVLNTAAKNMPADGTQMIVPPDTMVILQLTASENILFDGRQLHYIGTANQQNNFWVIRRAAGTSIEDIRKREVVSGHSGSGSTGLVMPALARETLGVKVKLIAGYPGSRETLIAMERGEIDGAAFGWETWLQAVPQWFKSNPPEAVALMQLGDTPDPDMPTVPLVRQLVKKEDLPLVSLFDTIGVVGRSLAYPPGVRPELVQLMRNAFESMLSDGEFRAEAAKRRLRLVTLTGPQLETAVKQAIDGADPAVVARAKRMLAE